MAIKHNGFSCQTRHNKGFTVKKLICMVLFSMLAAPTFAQDRYIADKLFTYMHSGPSNQYRIIGSIDAGEKVKLINTNKETDYTQIVDERGRTGWVESRFVTRDVSMAVRLPQLEKELTDVKSKLANARQNADSEKAGLVDSLEVRNKQIAELEKNYSDISKQLTASQSEVRELRAKLDTQKEDLLLKYFMYGGGVAGGGLLFGLVLPHIIPRRKRNPAGWA
ncbi:arylsulfatase [Vibrio furnissii CIP 102972]|nr:arylsulfatase [Vibrio furnissii CIP 102972]